METFSQLMANTLIAASIYAIIGLGFSLIYSSVRFFHFSHAAVFTIGAYSAFVLWKQLGVPLAAAFAFSIAICSVLGVGFEVFLYRPLRRHGASSLVLLLASLGLYIVAQNLLSLFFGDDSKAIRFTAINEGYELLGARVTGVQGATLASAIVLIAALAVLMRRTRVGTQIRAVAGDPVLASVTGIASDRIILACFALGSALAGIAAVLTALDVDMSPTMGMNVLMMGVVAAIIGGIGSVSGVASGAFLLALARHFGVWFIGSQWQDAIAFLVLVVFLLLKPQGVVGRSATTIKNG